MIKATGYSPNQKSSISSTRNENFRMTSANSLPTRIRQLSKMRGGLNHETGKPIIALGFGSLTLAGASAPAQQKLPPAPFIIADNNPVVIPAGQTSGTVTLEWDGGPKHPYAEVWVRVDENDETFIVEQGRGSRNVTVELGKNYEFTLSDSNVLLASVKVTVRQGRASTQPPPSISVSPRAVPTPAPLYSVSGTTADSAVSPM
jgi:hypothetical protein